MVKGNIFFRLQEFLSGNKPKFPVVVDSINRYKWQTDINGIFTHCSPEIKPILGFEPDEIIGNPLISFQLSQPNQILLRQTLEKQIFPTEIELTLLSKYSKEIPVKITIFQYLNNEKQCIGFRGYIKKKENLNGLSKSPAIIAPEIIIEPQKITASVPSGETSVNSSDDPSIYLSTFGQINGQSNENIDESERIDDPSTGKGRVVKPKFQSFPKKTLDYSKLVQTAPLPTLSNLSETPTKVNKRSLENKIFQNPEGRSPTSFDGNNFNALPAAVNQIQPNLANDFFESQRHTPHDQIHINNSDDLLEQLQSTLNETENLYSASHQLALSKNMTEMVTAIATYIPVDSINQGVLILFEYKEDDNIRSMTVNANYFNGVGTPPPCVGTEYLQSIYSQIFITPDPVFYDNLLECKFGQSLREVFLKQNVRSMAVLPLRSGETQIGVFLLQSDQQHRFSNFEMRSYPPLANQMSTAIQNLRLFQKTQAALAETELLYKISNGISKSMNLEELLVLVGQNALPKNADSLWLLTSSLKTQAKNPLFKIIGSYDKKYSFTSTSIPVDEEAFSYINFLNSSSLIFHDISKLDIPPASHEIFKQMNLLSAVIIPMVVSNKVIGLLIAGCSRLADFEEDEVRKLRLVGNNLTVALEKQNLLSEAQIRALELQTAAEIARDTTSTLSLEILLHRIVTLLQTRFGFYHCSIYLLDESKVYALLEESTGEAGFELKKSKFKLSVGSNTVIGTCTSSGNPVIIIDTQNDPRYFPNPMLPETKSQLGLPLIIGGRVIGALDIQTSTPNAFSENELSVLQILTDHISIAIENAKAFDISKQAIEDMREIDRVKSQFLANMSHELRTPLNSVIGFSRVILKGIDGPINNVQEQDITAIYNSGMHLLNMINEILDLSKIEAGKMELQFEKIVLSDIIIDAISTANGLIKDKPVKIVQLASSNIPLLFADKIRISQIVLNLLSNAVKFTESGTITIETALTIGPENKQEVIVTVKDTGIGISPENQEKLFQRFSQVDDSPTRKTGGTGLGLSISRSLIELHGGRIGLIESKLGEGSTFFFSLPIPNDSGTGENEHFYHKNNIILAIDDDPQIIDLYKRFLKPQGFEVIALTDSSIAVEKAKEIMPFAITLDIMMPQKDGWQVLKELKIANETREIPILVCSIIGDEEKGFSLGASEYLVKPFLQVDLVNAMRRLNKSGEVQEVLIIDDDPDTLSLVQRMVMNGGHFHPTIAQGGEQALQILNVLTPDLIILDLFMPFLNGFDILEKIKSNIRLSHIPVILLTGAELTIEQQNQLSDSCKSLIDKNLLKEPDFLKSLENTLNKFRLG
ncbi:MAG: response regulator [Chloroflexi bacterium]|nr:response regulator [Chloroflexota bacterium]